MATIMYSPQAGAGGQGTNPPGHNPNEDKTKEKFADFKEDLTTDEIASATSGLNSAQNNLNGSIQAKGARQTAWERADEMLKEYTLIHRLISLILARNAIELVDNINSVKSNRGALKVALKNAIKAVKLVNNKLLLVMEKANQLDKVLKDTCNKEEAQRLDQAVHLKGKLDDLVEMIKIACKVASINFDTAVKAAGIEALLNLTSIEELGKDIKLDIDDFKGNIDGNLGFFKEKDADTRGKLDEAISDVEAKTDDVDIARLKLDSYNLVSTYVDPNTTRSVGMNIDQIVDAAEKNFIPNASSTHVTPSPPPGGAHS